MAETGFERWTNRLTFAARQGARVAWYAGHGAALRRMVRRIEAENPHWRKRIERPSVPVPGMRDLLGGVRALLARDLANVEAGFYPPPDDEDGDLGALLERSRAFFRDAPEVVRRRHAQGGHAEVLERAGAEGSRRPDYYMQNFHFQSGGWMTEESAQLYDMQVEVLFSGAANAMRRQALPPIAREIAGRDQRDIRNADLACGPGTFITQLRRAFPRLPTIALDLSEAYLQEARRRVGRAPGIYPVVAKAEAIPLADGALELATSIYLFHELPEEVRRAVAAEMARVVRPGGLLVVVDSLQAGDEPRYDGLLEIFPQLFHEPYFKTYLRDPLEAVFEGAGFAVEERTKAFLSKVLQLRRRPA